MTPAERAGYLAHSQSAIYERHVAEADAAVAEWIAATERRYVSYSAGKDSEVMLHLVRRQDPDCLAVWSDDEFNLPETLAQVDATPSLVKVAARIWHAEWFTAWADGPARVPPDREWQDDDSVRKYGGGLQAWAARHGYDGEAIGIRADESPARQRSIQRFGLLLHHSSGHWRSYPLGHWKTADVWAYLVSNNVPYNRAYDRLPDLGIHPDRQRIGPFAVDRVLPLGMLGTLRLGWPAEFERFRREHPEAGRYG